MIIAILRMYAFLLCMWLAARMARAEQHLRRLAVVVGPPRAVGRLLIEVRAALAAAKTQTTPPTEAADARQGEETTP